KEARKEDQRATRTASQKRVAKFEDKLAAEQKAKQTLRPDRLLATSLPTQQPSSLKQSSAVEDATPVTNTVSPTVNEGDTTHPAASSAASIDEFDVPMGDDTGAEVDDIDLSLLPIDDVNGPPTSESEGGFALGNFDNGSTDAFSVGPDDEINDDEEDEAGSQEYVDDVDMTGSSDEYKEEEDDQEDEDDDYEAVNPGNKRKNPSTIENAQQPQVKKSRKKSSAAANASDEEDDSTLFLKFLEYKKAMTLKKNKAEKAKTKRDDNKLKKSAVRESTHHMRAVQPSKPKVAPKSKAATKNESGSTGKKANEIGGIKKNWRSGIYTMTGAASSTASIAKSAGSGGEEEPGAFDQDESQHVAGSCSPRSGNEWWIEEAGSEDDVQLVPADVAEIDIKERGSASSSRCRPIHPCLGRQSRGHVHANAAEGFRAEVAKRWVAAFPKLPKVVEFKEKKIVRQEHPAIYAVAFQTVRTWRSETGKDAFEAFVLDLSAVQCSSNPSAITFAILFALSGRTSPIRLSTFSKMNIRLLMTVCQVKRALKLWENGYLPGDDVDKSSKKSSKKPRTTPTGFNNDPWGKEAKIKVVPLIQQLKPRQSVKRYSLRQGQSGDLEDEMVDADGDDEAGLGEDNEPEMTISD
ncbi:hypothetical protein BDZ89DRAFT_1049029, partial [Hymenopellis radicata]